MTIKSSGSLNTTEIVAEWGGSQPNSLSEYYSGGSLVYSGATDGSYAINNTFIRLKKNGSSNIIYNSSPTHQNSHAPDTAQTTIDVTLDCSANDYFQIYANINSTGSGHSVTNIYSDSSRRTFFGGYRIA